VGIVYIRRANPLSCITLVPQTIWNAVLRDITARTRWPLAVEGLGSWCTRKSMSLWVKRGGANWKSSDGSRAAWSAI